jgi:RNA polymerase sigma factor (sigma-70 family)
MLDMESTASLTAPEPTRAEFREDGDLVARFRAGEGTAFDEIVAAYQERIVRLASRLLGRPEEVEDAVQEVFLAVLRHRKRFRGECKFSTWLTTIAVNKCRSQRRRRLLRLQTLFRLAAPAATASEEDPEAESTEIHEELRRAVHRLPARYREPIVLRYFETLSVGEIAEVLGISANGVEVRLSRARRKLKETLCNRLARE